MDFFYPLLFLVPEFDGDAIEAPPFRLVKRKWETSTFDLATLATKHRLHLAYQAMDVFLSRCNLELQVRGQSSQCEANKRFESLRLALYSLGVSPFLSSFTTNYSINDYSGINSRDSEQLRSALPPGMEHGLTSDQGKVEAWPYELSFQCIAVRPLTVRITAEKITAAAVKSAQWDSLATRSLAVVAEAAKAAPQLLSLDQSQLHLWSALEALFPEVSSELSFKVAVYLAQLVAKGPDRLDYFNRVRQSYKLRCAITHGSKQGIDGGQWLDTWGILTDAYTAILSRGKMPSEAELLAELFERSDATQ